MVWHERFITAEDGTRLFCREAGEGTPLLMIHGAACDSEFFLALGERMWLRYRVILYDRRGYGRSDASVTGASDSTAHFSRLASDAACVPRETDAPGAAVLGCSYGALAALYLAHQYPELVDRTLLHEPPAYSMMPDDAEGWEKTGGKQYIRFGVTLEMEQKQHLRNLMESRRPTVSRDARFPNPIVFQSVRINQAVVGYLFSPGRPEGFSEDELHLIEYLSQVLSIEMQKNDSFAAESGIKYEYFLAELLEGRLKSDEFADERLRQLKRKVRPYYHLVQFSFDDVTSRHPSINYYYEQLLAVFPEALVGRVKGQIYLSHLFTLAGGSDRLQALIHPDIQLLLNYDQAHHSQYLITLRTFLLHDRNAVRAAEALFIHKSTFFFRMGKIADLLGEDIMRNSERLFNYELSFHLLDHLKALPREEEIREDPT